MIDDTTGHIRLADFGLAAILPANQSDARVHSFSGTPQYIGTLGPAGQRALYPRLLAHFFAVLSLSLPIAPEVLTDTQERGHGFSVDWWSYGIILFYLLTLEVRRWLTATLSLADGSLTSLVFLLLTPQTSLVSISTREPYGSLRCYCQGKHQLG